MLLLLGGRKGLVSFSDYGASRDYALEAVNTFCRALGARCEVVAEVSYMDQSKSHQLRT